MSVVIIALVIMASFAGKETKEKGMQEHWKNNSFVRIIIQVINFH